MWVVVIGIVENFEARWAHVPARIELGISDRHKEHETKADEEAHDNHDVTESKL